MGLLNFAAAGLGIIQGQQQARQSRRAAKQADPFAPLRPGFQDILSKIYGLPTSDDRAAQARTPIGQMERRLADLQRIQSASKYRSYRSGMKKDYSSEIADLESQIATAKSATPQEAEKPGSFSGDFLSNLPGLQFAIQQGTEAASRRASALGMSRSGNLLAEIAAFTTGTAQQRVGEEIDRIARFAGAGTGPETAATIRANAPSPLAGIGSAVGMFANLPK